MDSIRTIIAAIFLATMVAHGSETNFVPVALAGQTFVHDPSTIIKENGRYYIFATGPGIRAKSSPDSIHWTNGFSAFDEPPDWTFSAVRGFQGYSLWAPDVICVNGKYFLYYAVSTFGKNVSAIGVAMNSTLNQSATNYLWKDCGAVIQSHTNSPFNAIDPSVFLDKDGKLWLAFGSFWHGIYLTELNPKTGKRIADDAPLHRLAWNKTIEAPCLTRHGKFYYLFVNWGECCKGVDSTYQIRVGRAEKITGPYLDADGKDMADGGGTKFLATNGRYIGPGHVGILNDGNTTWFSYHYYDAQAFGRARLGLGKIDWSSGWPVAVK